jgi:hypothetical protein
MAKDNNVRVGTDGLAAALQQTVEAHAAEAEELAALRQAMLEANELNLQLHRKALDTLASMTREMERMRRTLKTLSTART